MVFCNVNRSIIVILYILLHSSYHFTMSTVGNEMFLFIDIFDSRTCMPINFNFLNGDYKVIEFTLLIVLDISNNFGFLLI